MNLLNRKHRWARCSQVMYKNCFWEGLNFSCSKTFCMQHPHRRAFDAETVGTATMFDCKIYKDKQRGRWQCVKLSFMRVWRILLLSERQIHSSLEWWKPSVWANFDLSNTCLHSNIHSNMLRFKTLLKGTLAGRSQGWDQNHMVCITEALEQLGHSCPIQ